MTLETTTTARSITRFVNKIPMPHKNGIEVFVVFYLLLYYNEEDSFARIDRRIKITRYRYARNFFLDKKGIRVYTD